MQPRRAARRQRRARARSRPCRASRRALLWSSGGRRGIPLPESHGSGSERRAFFTHPRSGQAPGGPRLGLVIADALGSRRKPKGAGPGGMPQPPLGGQWPHPRLCCSRLKKEERRRKKKGAFQSKKKALGDTKFLIDIGEWVSTGGFPCELPSLTRLPANIL